MYIIHLISEKTLNQTKESAIYKTIYDDLMHRQNTIIINYFIYAKNPLKDIHNKYIGHTYTFYKNYRDLLQKVRALCQKDVLITTITEELVPYMHKLKRDIGQEYTKNFGLYTNKAQERKIIGSKYPDNMPKLLSIDQSLPLDQQTIGLNFPVMIKPVAGVGSRGVMKASSLEELQKNIQNLHKTFEVLANQGLQSDTYIIEEYVDGLQYVINYRVDDLGKYYISIPTHVKTTQDVGIEGYGNWYRIITQDIYKKINKTSMCTLIEQTISAGNIRNTYISHNFKISSANQYKTIEINGRIGGYRLEMHRKSSDYNLYDMALFSQKYREPSILRNVMIMSIRADKEGTLVGFNKDVISEIKALPSWKSIRSKISLIDKKVGFASNGGQTLGTIVCVHDDQKQVEEDILSIKKLYKNICIIR